jgi:ribosomal-protein-alanine N-acetyltransferase
MKIHYQNQGFLIRNIIPSDAQGIFELDTDPEVMKYLGGVTMTSLKEAQNIVADILWQYDEFGTGRLALIDRKTNEFMGWTGIKRERRVRDFIYYDLGYRLKQKFWGKGIATEAAKFSLEYGFKALGLSEINAAADIEHTASQKVLMKSGMQLQGTFFFSGRECHWYSLTRQYWKNS